MFQRLGFIRPCVLFTTVTPSPLMLINVEIFFFFSSDAASNRDWWSLYTDFSEVEEEEEEEEMNWDEFTKKCENDWAGLCHLFVWSLDY